MLVLNRKPTEILRIGDEIVVTVLGVVGNRVRLGIEAPAKVPILRSELAPRTAKASPASEPSTFLASDPLAEEIAQSDKPQQ
jgi:carbon storage regulator